MDALLFILIKGRLNNGMKITVLTIFPEVFLSFLKMPLIERALKKGILTLDIVDIKHYAGGSLRHIDEITRGLVIQSPAVPHYRYGQ